MTNTHSKSEPNVVTIPAASAIRATALEDIRQPVRGIVEEAIERAERCLAEPLRGITIGPDVEDGLFPITKTGVSVEPIVEAAERFLDGLTAEERDVVSFSIDDDITWRSWHNTHFFLLRHGLLISEMSPDTKNRAMDILRVTMSHAGFENARDVMRLNGYVADLTGRPDEYDEDYYWISIFGTPSASEPWGWQIDGHHLIVNCLLIGDQLVMTPDFRGSEPVTATSGPHAGIRVFEAEESQGLAFYRGLSPAQRSAATIADFPPRLLVTTAQFDNVSFEESGLSVGDMSDAQRDELLQLITVYIGRIRPGHAEIRLDEVKQHLEETRFSWMGSAEDDAAFYYRILNPVLLIEFDHLPGIVYDNDEPSRRHVHTIVRTPNGNDYGRSVLLEHYRQHDHHDPGSQHRQGKR